MPSFHAISAGATGSGANRSHHGSGPSWPCNLAFIRIQRRRSGSEAITADCIASNVAVLTLLANSEAASGESHLRRLLMLLASPLMAFIAAATGTAIRGHAAISVS